MTRSISIIAALVVALVAPARGDVWKRASEPLDPTIDLYNAQMLKGDDAATAANTQSIGMSLALKQLDTAIEAYRAAAKARPQAAEPFFRIAAVLNSFFFDDCEQNPIRSSPAPITCAARIDRTAKAREMVDAWDRFEALAPLDPRINDLLVTRAITRTKLVASTPRPQALLEAAAKDYQALLDRSDDGVISERYGSALARLLVLGNLAETHMMLGDVERAIKVYIEAARIGARGSTMFGLAVALDRDERTSDAFRVIRELGVDNFRAFQDDFNSGSVFFVPAGEEEYYFALAHEAFGEPSDAIEHWSAFIRSGAHPQFQPRAKEHLDKLLLRRNLPRIDVPIAKPDLGRDRGLARSPFDPVTAPPPRPSRAPKLPAPPPRTRR